MSLGGEERQREDDNLVLSNYSNAHIDTGHSPPITAVCVSPCVCYCQGKLLTPLKQSRPGQVIVSFAIVLSAFSRFGANVIK